MPRQQDSGPTAGTAATLERQLIEEREKRRVERFYFLSTNALLLWVICTGSLQSVILSSLLLTVIIALLIGCAVYLEVNAVIGPLQDCMAMFSRRKLPTPRGKEAE